MSRERLRFLLFTLPLPRNPRKADLHSDICASFREVTQFWPSFLPWEMKIIKNVLGFWVHGKEKVQVITLAPSSVWEVAQQILARKSCHYRFTTCSSCLLALFLSAALANAAEELSGSWPCILIYAVCLLIFYLFSFFFFNTHRRTYVYRKLNGEVLHKFQAVSICHTLSF